MQHNFNYKGITTVSNKEKQTVKRRKNSSKGCWGTNYHQLTMDTQWPTTWPAFNGYNTYSRVDKSQENDGADNCPDCLDGALLEALSDDLVQAVTHASQLRWKSVRQRLMTSILTYRNCQNVAGQHTITWQQGWRKVTMIT